MQVSRIGLTFKLLFLTIAACSSVNAALAENSKEGTYLGDWGHFYYQSSVSSGQEEGQSLVYLVCNLEQQVSLKFNWLEVGLTVGDGGQLPAEQCAALRRRNIPAYESVSNTSILFSNLPQRRSAEAYLSNVDRWYVPEFLENEFRLFFGPESNQDVFENFDLSIPEELRLRQRYVLDDDGVTIEIDWGEREVQVIIGEGLFAGLDLEDAAGQLTEIGYFVELIEQEALEELSADPSFPKFSGGAVLGVVKPEGVESSFSLRAPVKADGFTQEPLAVINSDGQLLFSGFVYAPFGEDLR